MMRADQKQAGYATVTVAVLLGALSLIAVAWRDLSLGELRRAASIRDIVRIDAALDASFTEVISELSLGEIDEERATHDRTFSGVSLSVELQSLQAHINVNQASPASIQEGAAREGLSETATAILLQAVAGRRPDAAPFNFLEDISSDELFQAELPCIRRAFTTFQNVAPLLSDTETRWLPDGALFSLRLKHTGAPFREVLAIAMLTGDPSRPLIVFDWRRIDQRRKEDCNRANAIPS